MIGNRQATPAENAAVLAVVALLAPELPEGGFRFCLHIDGFRLDANWHAEWQITGRCGEPAPPGGPGG